MYNINWIVPNLNLNGHAENDFCNDYDSFVW